MEYTIEFGAALIVILFAAMIFWGVYWKNEIKATFSQRDRLKSCSRLEPIQFSTVRKTDVIQIESLKHQAAATQLQRQRKSVAGQQ